jgi:CHASE3 domain sensor protein
MENRSIFALDGITGMLIAVVLLLSIVAGLTFWSVSTQAANSTNFYKMENEKEIRMFGSDASKHMVDAHQGEK